MTQAADGMCANNIGTGGGKAEATSAEVGCEKESEKERGSSSFIVW